MQLAVACSTQLDTQLTRAHVGRNALSYMCKGHCMLSTVPFPFTWGIAVVHVTGAYIFAIRLQAAHHLFNTGVLCRCVVLFVFAHEVGCILLRAHG
jgi:hypothetical protein